MSHQDSHHLTRPVRPNPVRDDRAIPGAGVHDSDHGHDAQQDIEVAIQPGMADDHDQGQGSHKKDQQELSVTHRSNTPPRASLAGRAAGGYQSGLVASVLAAVVASAFAAVASWTSPLEATAEFL